MTPDEAERTRGIYHRSIDPDGGVANTQLVRLVADVEGCEVDDLPPLWPRIDDVVSDVFSDPPSPAAQVQLEFTYAGYRIDVDQSGTVELMKVGETPADGR